jgi:hypothetical protein
MAQIKEEILVIRISQIVKDGSDLEPRITDEVTAALTQVAEELVGAGAIVEIEQAG